MKLFLLLFVAVVFSNLTSAQIDVLHYRFELELTDRNDSLHGNALITLRATEKTSQLQLDLVAVNKNGQGMTVSKISSGANELPFTQSPNKVHISLMKPLDSGSDINLRIVYAGIPADGLIISHTSHGQRSFFSDNWPDRAHNWIPCIDKPADKASVEFIVIAPDHYQVVSNGLRRSIDTLSGGRLRTHWQESVPLATKVMAVGVAKFASEKSGEVAGIPVSSWVYPEDSVNGLKEYGMAPPILEWFQSTIGPYPFRKLANVQSKTTYGGMENASAIFYNEAAISADSSFQPLLAHEIAHQWFGNMITEKDFAHVWLSEGFATYMTMLYMEHKYGADSMQTLLHRDRLKVLAFDRQHPGTVVDSTTRPYINLLNARSYEKAGWVLHMLRQQMGDSVFFPMLNRYYARYAGLNAETKDFIAVCNEIGQTNYNAFFHQWLFQQGNPELNIEIKNRKGGAATLHIAQQQEGRFSFPISFRFWLKDGSKIERTFSITQPDQSFDLSPGSPIISVMPDPETQLLYALKRLALDGKVLE